MSRKYTKVKHLESQMLEMQQMGMTKRAIGEALGLSTEQVKETLKRYRRRRRQLEKGSIPKPHGRPRGKSQTEIERLRMENKLLRDFLQFTERK